MMLGSKMEISTDREGGRTVGSRVAMRGKVLAIPLALEEVVVQREPPTRKAWETMSANLLVIGDYRLGFELEPTGPTCAVRVFIEYDLPSGALTRWRGALREGVCALVHGANGARCDAILRPCGHDRARRLTSEAAAGCIRCSTGSKPPPSLETWPVPPCSRRGSARPTCSALRS